MDQSRRATETQETISERGTTSDGVLRGASTRDAASFVCVTRGRRGL